MITYPNENDKKVELEPTNGRKSFYKKAFVFTDSDGNEFLKSYDTFICYKDKKGIIHRLCDYVTMTTCTHIKSFCGLNKSKFMKLVYEGNF